MASRCRLELVFSSGRPTWGTVVFTFLKGKQQITNNVSVVSDISVALHDKTGPERKLWLSHFLTLGKITNNQLEEVETSFTSKGNTGSRFLYWKDKMRLVQFSFLLEDKLRPRLFYCRGNKAHYIFFVLSLLQGK